MTPSFELHSGSDTATGRVRDHNEDAHAIDRDLGLFVVADGMGGHNAGERASALAVKELGERLSAERRCDERSDELREAFVQANQAIFRESLEMPARRGMGTTMTALWVNGSVFRIGHVGDSRAWRIRDGSCEQLTEDHSVVAEQLRAGLITTEQADVHPLRNVLTRSLGNLPDVDVDVLEGELRAGDVFVLGTDGMIGALDAPEIAARVDAAAGPEAAARELVRYACEADGTDNVTVIVVACRRPGEGS